MLTAVPFSLYYRTDDIPAILLAAGATLPASLAGSRGLVLRPAKPAEPPAQPAPAPAPNRPQAALPNISPISDNPSRISARDSSAEPLPVW